MLNRRDRHFLFQVKEYSEVDEETGCREWSTALHPTLCVEDHPNSRGQVRVTRKLWEIFYGEIPEGLIIRHRCDNTRCVNINHLEIGTHQDNRMDRAIRQET